MVTEDAALIGERTQPDPLPPEEEIQVMTLIVSGLTDQAIARRLGVSVITVRRRATRFRHRMGASTRIEAAVIAAKRGIL